MLGWGGSDLVGVLPEAPHGRLRGGDVEVEAVPLVRAEEARRVRRGRREGGDEPVPCVSE